MPLRTQIRERYYQSRTSQAEIASEQDIQAPAIVFSPHQDDETLGLGGTIARKQAAGAQVQIVFLTDGTQSHAAFQEMISPEQLTETRYSEALQAAQVLGVDEKQVHFLGFPDTQLNANMDEAGKQVLEVLQSSEAQQIFLPCQHDPQSDHIATYSIVNNALRQAARDVEVYEYPIWAWNRWPFVNSTPLLSKSAIKKVFMNGGSLRLGWRSLLNLNYAVQVQEHLDTKRNALDQHKTQTTRYGGLSTWPILADVAKGEWVDCFFRDFEFFFKSKLNFGK